MKMKRGFVIVIVAVVVLLAGAIILTQSGSQDNDLGTGIPQGQSGGQQQSDQSGGSPGDMQPPVKEFVIEADDYGFYIDGEDTSSISTSSGEDVEITFNVRNTRVYYAGLDFRGCGLNTGKVSPGASKTVEFSAVSTCTITSYWPSSGVVKDNLQVIVS